MALDLLKYLKIMSEKNASDLHLKVGAPPIFRIVRKLVLSDRRDPFLTNEDIKEAVQPLLGPFQENLLLENKQVDFSYGIEGLGRFRFNVFFQRGTLRVVVRHIPFDIPDFKSLNLPEETLSDLVNKNRHGLILVTGATGNGKSSTIAAILNYINNNQSRHIITIEDPIEFLIRDKKSLITQRDLGTDYVNYGMALKASLRQDPDVIFFGELRDASSAEIALNAANTGHLVFSTLHTNNAAETVIRVLGMFNQENKKHIRTEFASCLKAIICQRLILRKDGDGFYPALEILINNPLVRETLEDETKSVNHLSKIIKSSRDVWGMQSFNQHLKDLYEKGVIGKETALKASDSSEDLELSFQGLGYSDGAEDRTENKDSPLQPGTFSNIEDLTLETSVARSRKWKRPS